MRRLDAASKCRVRSHVARDAGRPGFQMTGTRPGATWKNIDKETRALDVENCPLKLAAWVSMIVEFLPELAAGRAVCDRVANVCEETRA